MVTSRWSPILVSGFKLKRSYQLLALISIIAPLITAGVILAWPRYFIWADNYQLAVWALLGIAVYQAVVFLLHRWLGWLIFWSLLAVGWPVFYFLIVVATGGVNSSFIFLLIIPLINSTIRLEQKETRAVGILLTALLILVFFTKTGNLFDFAAIARHSINVAFFTLIAIYFYKVVSDTLHYKVAKEDIQQQLSNVLELSNIKNTFLTTASHQLRTPISAASWALEELESDNHLSPTNQEILGIVRGRLDKTLEIIDNLLKTAEITTEDYDAKIRHDKICLQDLLNTLVEEVQSLSRKNEVTVTLSLPETKLYVLGNYQLLLGALLNLVDNAVRYTKNGHVTITLDSSEQKINLKVVDDGIGISDEDQKHLFEKFYRGKNALAIDSNHSGVGLALSRRVIELHNGQLTLNSKLGQGSTATVILNQAVNSVITK